MCGVIRTARRRLALSLYKCNEPRILDELAGARKRGVAVEVLLTTRTGGSRRKLKRLHRRLDALGVVVYRPRDPDVPYHAKYIVADDRQALIGSLNLTRKCFRSSCDFLVVTTDTGTVAAVDRLFRFDGAVGSARARLNLPSDRLVAAPQHARGRVRALIRSARRRIAIVDPKLTDPDINTLLRARVRQGIQVDVLGGESVGGLSAHGKALVIDDRLALVGSMSLSPAGLEERRELGIVIDNAAVVGALVRFIDEALAEPWATGGGARIAGRQP